VSASFSVEGFERQAEAFARARGWAEWQYIIGERPGRSLAKLYSEDFPDFTSLDLFIDLSQAPIEDADRKRALTALLANVHLEGLTRDISAKVSRGVATATVSFEDADLSWRAAPDRWTLLGDVPRRHAMYESWRATTRSELNPHLERWQPALLAALQPLGATDWCMFWSEQRGLDLQHTAVLAESLISLSDSIYPHALGVYFGQFDLPVDDAWPADADYAFRAPQFDTHFPAKGRVPAVIGTFRGLGVDVEAQTNLKLDNSATPGVHLLPIDVPNEVHVALRPIGGYLDYERTFRGIAEAQHMVQSDARLPFTHRWLGDDTATVAYGRLFERLVRDKTWLSERLELTASEDFRVVSHLAWLYRLRSVAARLAFERQLWTLEPGSSLAATFDDAATANTRVRHFPEAYLLPLVGGPWSTLSSAVELRAEIFAAQLRAYLRREFADEWWRDPRAARFLVQELWRPGRRHSAEHLLGFMGYEGFDVGILWADISEVLSPL
jgi:hypothetical protein